MRYRRILTRTLFIPLALSSIPTLTQHSVAYASTSPADSVHFCAPFDYERWQSDHPLPAGKRLADRNKGEPRTVRMIYFLPNDRPYRQGVVDKMKAMMRRVQTFYAEQMQAHGYGNRTFRFETIAQGEPLVHRVDGQHPERHYDDNNTKTEILDEIYFGEGPLQFDILENHYLIVIDNSTGRIDVNGYKAGGVNTAFGKRGGITLVPSDFTFFTVAHELGHTFGLVHDFRDDAYIMSYGFDQRSALSACAAEFLSVHPYFNSDSSLGMTRRLDRYDDRTVSSLAGGWAGESSTIEIISPADYPAGSTKVSIQLKVSDAEGLHQVLLLDVTREPHSAAGLGGLVACRGLAGEKDAIVEFEYDVSIPPFRRYPSDPELHHFYIYVVDRNGEITRDNFKLVGPAPYHIATLDHQNYIRSVSFSPDGTLLATSEWSIPTARLWDTASRQQVATLELETSSSEVLFSPDGTLLAIAESGPGLGGVSLWDVASRQRVATLQPGGGGWDFRSLSFSPDGTLLAIGAGGGGEVSLWDVASRQRVATLQPNIVVNNLASSFVRSIAFSPDGTLLAVSGTTETYSTVSLWDVASRQRVATLQDFAFSVAFSPDGTLLAIGADRGGVRLWDVASRQEITLEPKTGGLALAFSPDGTLFAIGADGLIRLWDVASRQLVTTLVHPALVTEVAFSPDGILLATGGDFTVRLWDVSEWTGHQAVITVEQAMPHTLTKISGERQEGLLGAQLAKPFVVSVLDQNGSALAGAVVTFSVTVGGGTLSSTTTTTDANGRARSRLTLGSEPGTNTVTATVAGLDPVTFTATATEQIPHSLTKVSGEGQEGPASTQLAAPFVVSVLDQDDSPLVGVDVTFSVTAGGGMLAATTNANSCTIGSSTSSTTVTTDADGQAATRLTLGSEPGTNTVSATIEGLEPVTFTATATEQVTPHSLTKVCGDDQEGTTNELLANPFVVSVSDENGTALAGVDVSFAVTAGGGTLSATTATTNANGRAATRLTLGREAGTNTVTATVEGLQSVTFTTTGEKSALDSLFDTFLGSGKLAALPDHTQLLQNAPNPFNSQTVLSYFLLKPGPVRLEVFALTGQRIAVLHQGQQQAGYHRLHWDGRDDTGHPVASGAYLYRLMTDETLLTRKLILLR